MSFFEFGQNEKDSAVQHSRNNPLIRRVARMYYEERLTQHDIATQLRFSQGTVCRLLQKAEEHKIIRTTVSPPMGTFVDLEELLEQKFALAQVIIARAPNDSEQSAQGAVGAAAAHFLGTTLKSKSVIGVAPWSASLLSMVEQMHPVWKICDCKVVQILGGVGNPSVEKHANCLVRQLADLLRGEAHLLPVPGLVASKVIADVLAQDPHVRETMALFDRITVALLGISSIKLSPCLAGDESSCSVQELQDLKDRGAVGQVCLRFYDINGEEIKGKFESRVVGLEHEQLKRIPTAVGIACGKQNRRAILGALRGRWINVLITDQFTAQSLVME